MENTPVVKKRIKLTSNPLFLVTVAAFLIRLGMLLFVLTVGTDFSPPYFIADDIKYENITDIYIHTARHIFDMRAFDNVTVGYLQVFWPWVMCNVGYIFKSVFAGRFVNIILSSLCVPLIYKITHKISENKKTAITAASVFAFMPVTIITCVFPIKDIFITFGVLYALYVCLKFQYDQKIKIYEWLFMSLILVLVYLTRGAVSELILIYLAVIFLKKKYNRKNHLAIIAFLGILLLAFLLFGNILLSSFDTKIDTYSGYGGSGALNLRIRGITDIYKLPFTYFFASLQPVTMNLFKPVNQDFWMNVLTIANVTLYPISIGNFIYIFTKKKNTLFWLFTATFFCSVIILSLGIFRHYLFLMPVQMINFSLFIEQNRKTNTIIVLSLSTILLCMVLLLSILAA